MREVLRKMRVVMFQPQFAGKVLSGEKCQTIRPIPKRWPRAGELLCLRRWRGAPYRSRHEILRIVGLTELRIVEITQTRMHIDAKRLSPEEEWNLAKDDGFNTPQDMIEWFNKTHGLPFIGLLIKWDL